MAWIDTYWAQIDSQNSSYPFISDTGLALQADVSGLKTIWSISESQNFGLPFISDTELASQADLSNSKSIWKIHPKVNFGFPYITTVEEIPQDGPVFPVFTGFSEKGTGGHFRYQKSEKALNIPTTAEFSFRIPENIEFHFSDLKEVIL